MAITQKLFEGSRLPSRCQMLCKLPIEDKYKAHINLENTDDDHPNITADYDGPIN